MTTEVHRHKNSLSIRWANEAGDLWAVTKKFDADTDILESATVRGPAHPRFDSATEGREHMGELEYACDLADRMDRIFRHPNNFDLVAIDDVPTTGGYPALIFPLDDSGHIYIRIASKS